MPTIPGIPSLEPFIRGVAKEVARATLKKTPTLEQIEEIAWRLRRLQLQVNHLVSVVDRKARRPGSKAVRGGGLKALPKICSRRGCERPATSRSMCMSHYLIARRRRLARE